MSDVPPSAPPSAPRTPQEALAVFARDALFRYGNDRIEIEFRLGRRVGDSFEPGVPEAAFERIREALAGFPCEYIETTEQYMDAGRYVEGKRSKPDGTQEPFEPYCMYKKRLHAVDLDLGVGPLSARGSVSLETIETPAMKPYSCDFERHKRRWRYSFRPWTFDLTRVRSNAPGELDSDTDIFEVEVELADTEELFVRPLSNALQWGWTMISDFAVMTQK